MGKKSQTLNTGVGKAMGEGISESGRSLDMDI